MDDSARVRGLAFRRSLRNAFKESTMITTVVAVAVVVAVGHVLLSRWRGQPVNPRRLYVLPAVLCAIGLMQISGTAAGGIRATDVALIAAGVAVSAVMGVARGVTVAVFAQDGAPWVRYRPATLAFWAATIAARVVVAAAASHMGAWLATRGPAIILSVGVTLLAEGVVVGRRAYSTARPQWQARA
jgi:hypothetical protein